MPLYDPEGKIRKMLDPDIQQEQWSKLISHGVDVTKIKGYKATTTREERSAETAKLLRSAADPEIATRNIYKTQRDVQEIRDKLNRERGEILTLASAGAATVRLTHKLGKVPTYFLIISKDANADIWRNVADPWDTNAVTLRTSAGVNAKVRVW